MPKRLRGFTLQKMDRWIKEGRGQGQKGDYKPWLTTQDVSSQGRRHRLHGNKLDREHDFLSDLELRYFLTVEFADCVTDIKEQYPLLPLSATEDIANKLGIKHHTDPQTQCHQVVTTDFLITVLRDGKEINLARTVKYKDQLFDKRQMEKFQIERKYWEGLGVDWGIVTEEEIDETLAFNISECYKFYDISKIDSLINIAKKEVDKLIDSFKYAIIDKKVIVREQATEFDNKMVLLPGTALSIFRHLVITKQVKIDMFKKLDVDSPQNVILNENMRDRFEEVRVG